MSNVYLTSDVHLGHRNIANFRVNGFTSEEQWNLSYEGLCTLKKRDTLMLLGDVAFDHYWLGKVKELPCTKVLIVGNHCVSGDTEVLTKRGWKNAVSISYDDLVASKDLSSGEIGFYRPTKVEILENRLLYSVKSTHQDELVSDGHCCIYKGNRVPIESLVGGDIKSKDFDYGGTYINTELDLTPNFISWVTWVVTDGCIVQGESPNKKRIQFKLSKQRKIDALEKLLNLMCIPYTKKLCKKSGINVLQPYYIRIYGEHARLMWNFLDGVKQFPEKFMYLSGDLWQSFYDTLCITDGSVECGALNIVTVNSGDANVIQTAAILNNHSCSIKQKINLSGFANGKLQHIIRVTKNGNNKTGSTTVVEAGTGTVVAISVRHETLVTRRNGKAVITGNCTTPKIKMKHLVDVYDKVFSLLSYKGHWLSHAPIHPMELRGKKNIHGHCHPYLMTKEVYGETVVDDRYINVCVEYVGYTPIKWEYAISEEYKQECLIKYRQFTLEWKIKP